MTAAELIKYAAQALSLYHGLRAVAQVRGMTVEEFDAQAAAEEKRVDGYRDGVAAAIDGEFEGG